MLVLLSCQRFLFFCTHADLTLTYTPESKSDNCVVGVCLPGNCSPHVCTGVMYSLTSPRSASCTRAVGDSGLVKGAAASRNEERLPCDRCGSGELGGDGCSEHMARMACWVVTRPSEQVSVYKSSACQQAGSNARRSSCTQKASLALSVLSTSCFVIPSRYSTLMV